MTADTLAQLASTHGLPGVLARVGAASRGSGQPPGKSAWTVAVPSAKDPAQPAAALQLFNRASAVAGGLEEAVTIGERRFAPIIDVRTGWPVSNGVVQVTVTAPSAIQAGVLATAAFILGLPAGIDFIQSFPACEGSIVTTATRGNTRGFLEGLSSS
jgi:thiamine biosynthesis lipoprotein